MSDVALEVALIIILVIGNGIFAMSEMAVVSARKTRLQHRAEKGDARARAALELANAPDRFLSTVQIGITLVGILAGAFGGATISEQLGARLDLIPQVAPYGEVIALGLVVIAITYLSLVVGELVPKRLALGHPEAIAAFVARPMTALSKLAAPAARLLSFSTNLLLKIFRVRPSADPPVTEEEIVSLVAQGTEAGVFHEAEGELVESVLGLADRRVSRLMTPRLEVVTLDVNATIEEVRRKVSEHHYSRFPVMENSVDNVIGVVKTKDLLARSLAGEALDLRASLRPPLFVPNSNTGLQVLETFKRSHTHFAVVVNEHGALEGVVTMTDVLEAIVGNLPQGGRPAEPLAVRRDDGSWLLDGAFPAADFADIFPGAQLLRGESDDYQTLAGFALTRLGRLPRTGESFDWSGLRFEIVDMDRRRIDKILVTPLEGDAPEEEDAPPRV